MVPSSRLRNPGEPLPLPPRRHIRQMMAGYQRPPPGLLRAGRSTLPDHHGLPASVFIAVAGRNWRFIRPMGQGITAWAFFPTAGDCCRDTQHKGPQQGAKGRQDVDAPG